MILARLGPKGVVSGFAIRARRDHVLRRRAEAGEPLVGYDRHAVVRPIPANHFNADSGSMEGGSKARFTAVLLRNNVVL